MSDLSLVFVLKLRNITRIELTYFVTTALLIFLQLPQHQHASKWEIMNL